MEALRFRDFSYAYEEASAPILRGLDWSVPEGSFTLLVGATGAGKTTLLRCAKPELMPAGVRSGVVESFGRPLTAESGLEDGSETLGAELAVGYVAQNPENQVVCDSVWHELAFGLENLGVPQDAMRRRVAEVAHFFGIEPWFDQDVASLSGGQKQLLNLASTLALRPRLLLLDEPTGQLDPVAAKNFLHALFRVNRECGITVVMATHAPESAAEYATDVVELRDGRVRRAEGNELANGLFACGMPCAARQGGRAGGDGPSDRAAWLDRACFRYERSGPWVLRGASVQVAEGSLHAIVGGNGCGKSTALRLLAGALKPERGQASSRLRNAQALVPQDPRTLFVCDTVAEELAEWSGAAGYGMDEIQAVVERFGLSGLLDRHPYDVSGGQQQLLALAKVLLVRPRLLLLDEPVKGLDPETKLTVALALERLRDEGVTIVVVSHDLSFVSCVADRVTMLFDGEDACTEPPAEFFRENLFFRPEHGRFARLWEERTRP